MGVARICRLPKDKFAYAVFSVTAKFLVTFGIAAMLCACGKPQEMSALPWPIWYAVQPGQRIEDLGTVLVALETSDVSPSMHNLAVTQAGQPVFWEIQAYAAINTPVGTQPQRQSVYFDMWWRCTASSLTCAADAPPISLGRETVSLVPSHSLRANPYSDDTSNFTLVNVSGAAHVLLTGRARGSLAKSIEVVDYLQPRNIAGATTPPMPNLEQLIANTPGELLVSINPAKPGTPSAAWAAMQVRINLFGSEVSSEPPSQRLAVRAKLAQWSLAGTPRIGLAAGLVGTTLLAMLIWAMRRSKNYPSGLSDDAPTRFGFLVCLWGCALAAVPLTFAFMQGSVSGGWYYISLGLLYAWSGLFMRHGLSKGFDTSIWALAIAVGWSAIDFDLMQRQFWMQIGMPAIVTFAAFVVWKKGQLDAEAID